MTQHTGKQTLELWGGVEPTINRVGDRFFSQCAHRTRAQRLSDLDTIAQVGLCTLRFPILWEEIAPDSPEVCDWTLIDAQLRRLQELGVKPIAGLVHHGSGPRYTSLTDLEFPQKLATFARAVAERYPWIDAYTPVNEPLTTARFSGLYGLWYPHARDEQTFARCLTNQCRGVVRAMRAIREVNSAAQLIQTDDLGKTYSTPQLQYQADYENERRWLTWDLLTGRLNADSWMWRELHRMGIPEHELVEFREQPCPPEVIGVNHYITSERFLDENFAAHPPETHGGNGRDCYADVAAVRVRPEGIAGAEGVLREAWERYRLPLAVTEAHIGCTREEQLRWFSEVWRGAGHLRGEGADVRAVTVWSLLGAHDWNSLLTRQEGFYEPGAFDTRGGVLRPTAVAKMVQELAHGRGFDHPTLAAPGWWRRNVRMLQTATADECLPRVELVGEVQSSRASRGNSVAWPVLITGGGGRLAQGFVRAAELRGLPYQVFSHGELDIADADAVAAAVQLSQPWAIVNCAGFANVDDAEAEEFACRRANADGAAVLARICEARKIPLVAFSSDHVFDGGKRTPYLESDQPAPLNVYGESKMLADQQVLHACAGALVIRPGKVFAPLEDSDFLRENLRALARGETVRVANDIRLSGTYLPDLVHTTLDLLIDGECGIWHLAHRGAVTPEQLLRAAAEIAEIDTRRIEGTAAWRLRRPALRASYRVLESARAPLLPPLEDALQRYWRETPPIYDVQPELLATS